MKRKRKAQNVIHEISDGKHWYKIIYEAYNNSKRQKKTEQGINRLTDLGNVKKKTKGYR